ncbi:hypothetical protein WMF30_10640 [Sorangium sp. So ce134]
MTNPERPPKKRVCDDDIDGNGHHALGRQDDRMEVARAAWILRILGELKLTGLAALVVASSIAALIYSLAQGLAAK